MRKFSIVNKEDRGLREHVDKGTRELGNIDFLDGTLIKEENANGELVDFITVSLNSSLPPPTGTYYHGLGRVPRGFLVVDSYHSTSGVRVYPVRTDNPNGDQEPESEYITFFFPASGTLTYQFRIWVF